MNTEIPEADLAAVVRAYEHAFNTNDAEALNALFTPDTVFVNVAGTVVRGAEALYRAQRSVFSGPLRDTRAVFTVDGMMPLGPDAAVVHVRQDNNRPPGPETEKTGDGEQSSSVLVLVMVKDAEGWRIRAGQNTPVAA